MEAVEKHAWKADVSFDGGDLDCGNGLLLLIRKHLDPLKPGQLIEIRSIESSVEQDLPAWCRLTKNQLVSFTKMEKQRSYLVSKGSFDPQQGTPSGNTLPGSQASPAGRGTPGSYGEWAASPEKQPAQSVPLPEPAPAPTVPALSSLSIGSWPRPRWLLRSLHEYLEGRICESEFNEAADDAVRLCVQSQLKSGVDVITDGEQRRDNYASFVATKLENCQLIPLVDLLPMVDDPEKFQREMDSLDVPADQVRHPAVFGRIQRKSPLALDELEFLKTLTNKPVKIALPGPYLLTRIMWMECIADKAYESREALAADIVQILREEIHFLLAGGAGIVQLDEPVLTEIVFAKKTEAPRFMCGALSRRQEPEVELQFATDLINKTLEGLPRERMALHVCRGNWSPDESVALTGDYRPLLPVLNGVNVGTLFLEFCTDRAGDLEILREISSDKRIGLGVINQKHAEVEPVAEIVARAQRAMKLIGPDRLVINPDCGFATFADNPVSSAAIAEAKLRALAAASNILRGE